MWSWPAAFVPPHGGARATAIAIFNIFGAVGGFIGPTLLGKLSDASGDYSKAMLVLGAMDLASALMFLGAPMEVPMELPSTPYPKPSVIARVNFC